MDFLLSKVAWALLMPGNLLLLLLAGGLLMVMVGWRRLGMGLATGATVGFLAIAILPVGDWALYPLERRFPVVTVLPDRVDGVIVLGGAVMPERTAQWGVPSLNAHGERMTAFAELARRYPEAKLVFTGGSGSVRLQHIKEAPVARDLWARIGLDVGRIIFEDQSRNTWENAVFTRDLVQPRPGEVWLLVTSASHMPRSMGIFRRTGWDPIPVPVAFKSTPPGEGLLVFNLTDGMTTLGLAVREWIGLIAYRVMGRMDELVPGPKPAAP